MRKLFFVFFSMLFAGCTVEMTDVHSGLFPEQYGSASSLTPIEFVLSDAPAGEESGPSTKSETAVPAGGSCLTVATRRWPVLVPDTKVTPVTAANLDSLYVCTQYRPSGYVTVCNTVYRKGADGVFSCSGQYWPYGSYNMTVWASNAPGGLYSGPSYSGQAYFDCPDGVDVIAGVTSVSSGQQFALPMRHVYARIGSLAAQAPEGFAVQNVSGVIECPVEGDYMCWTRVFVTDGTETLTLSADNDILVVPGTYDLTVTFDLTDGSTVRQGIVRTGNVTLEAGKINDITASLPDRYDYSLKVTPSPAEVNVGADAGLTATLTTSYGGSVLSVDDVTSTASWTSLEPGVATVSSGTVHGVRPGTAGIEASCTGVSDTVQVSVLNPVVSCDLLVGSFVRRYIRISEEPCLLSVRYEYADGSVEDCVISEADGYSVTVTGEAAQLIDNNDTFYLSAYSSTFGNSQSSHYGDIEGREVLVSVYRDGGLIVNKHISIMPGYVSLTSSISGTLTVGGTVTFSAVLCVQNRYNGVLCPVGYRDVSFDSGCGATCYRPDLIQFLGLGSGTLKGLKAGGPSTVGVYWRDRFGFGPSAPALQVTVYQ